MRSGPSTLGFTPGILCTPWPCLLDFFLIAFLFLFSFVITLKSQWCFLQAASLRLSEERIYFQQNTFCLLDGCYARQLQTNEMFLMHLFTNDINLHGFTQATWVTYP